MRHLWKQFRWWILRPQLFELLNPCITRGSNFVEDFSGHRCCLRCRFPASPKEAVSLTISE
jgi:hypothetical protein